MIEFLTNLDFSLLRLINIELSNSFFDQFMPAITDLHKSTGFKILAPSLFILLFVKKFGSKKGLLIFVGLLLSLGLSDLIGNHLFKKNFERLRPGDNPKIEVVVRSPYGGYSFISNHAANMFTMATYTSAFIPVSGFVLYPLAATVAYSRVYNGVHFPSDVFAGALLGFCISLLTTNIFKRISKERNNK
jgi:undecaprenyl-diphosphatase